jgi:hypothetical protein
MNDKRRTGGSMKRCIAIVKCDIDPAVEAQFNEFYNGKHLGVALNTPGFLNGQRFRLIKHLEREDWDHPLREEFYSDAGEQRYIAMYELESPDIVEHLAEHEENKTSVEEFLEWANNLRNVSISFYEGLAYVDKRAP